ncbi:MAG: homoserine dehydrogenase [Eubacteriales bacterium]|nr:homoserine dehydrogenase [Eubacteriales bacterium]
MIKAAVLGFGTVGSGVVELFDVNRSCVERRVPEGIEVKYILDLREFPDSPYQNRVVHDFDIILNDPEIRVICETMGGREPAFTFSKKALEKGISVCTSNKELVAAHGPELLRIAREHNCSYLFEASVGGGIPIIRPMNTSLAPESITRIVGILNGTTNYMMTRMEQEDISFEDVLKQAQEKGYAERNPEADIEGHDACRKIAILSSLMCGRTVRYEDIPCEGISRVSMKDVAYARRMGYAIKLLGISERDEEKGYFYVRTAPYMVPASHPLHGVEGVFNAIFVHGNLVDNLMFYGRGAGKFPTASAVVSDMLDCALNLGQNIPVRWSDEVMQLSDPGQKTGRYFVRMSAEGREKAKALFADSFDVTAEHAHSDEYVFTTGPVTESAFKEAVSSLPDVRSTIRILEL